MKRKLKSTMISLCFVMAVLVSQGAFSQTITVLSLHGGALSDTYQENIIDYLVGFDDIGEFIFWDVSRDNPVPTLEEIQETEADVVWLQENAAFGEENAIMLGNILADLIDVGGNLVISQFSFTDFGRPHQKKSAGH